MGGGGLGILRPMKRLPETGVLPQALAVTANCDEAPVMDKALDERGRHDIVSEDVPIPRSHCCA